MTLELIARKARSRAHLRLGWLHWPLAGLGLLTMVASAVPAAAFDAADLATLMQTKQCVNCNLEGADLRYLDLSGVNLQGANLNNANFFRSRLDDANLARATLVRANFGEANLRGTVLNLADLSHSNLLRANFSEASLYGTVFYESYIAETRFTQALMANADLRRAWIVSADFTGADLCGAAMPYGEYRYGCQDNASSVPEPAAP